MGTEKEHPTYFEMIAVAINAGDSRKGTSRSAILKHIVENYKVGDPAKAATRVKLALKAGLEKGKLKKAREVGKGSGAFKLVKEEKPKKVKKKAPAAAKKAVSSAAKSTAKASARKNSLGGATSAKPKKVAKKAITAKDSKKAPVKKAAPKKAPSKKTPTKKAAKSPAAKKVRKKKAVPAKSPKPKSVKKATPKK